MAEFLLAFIVLGGVIVGGGVLAAQAQSRAARARLLAEAHPDAGLEPGDTAAMMRSKNRAYELAGDMAALLERILASDEAMPCLTKNQRERAETLVARYREHR